MFTLWKTCRAVLLVGLCSWLIPTDAQAQQFSNSYYYRNPRSGRTYSFGTSYNNGYVSSYVGRSTGNSRFVVGSGAGRGHVSGGYSYGNRRYGNSFYWRN